MTSHDRFLDLAAGAIDFDPSPAEQATMELHLATCSACRRQVAGFRADAAAIAALPRPRLVPDRSDAILSAIVARPRSAFGLRTVLVAALVALLLATIAVAVGAELLRRSREVPVIPPPLVIHESPEPSRPVPSDPPPVFSAQALGGFGTLDDMPLDIASNSNGRLIAVIGMGGCTTLPCPPSFLHTDSIESGAWSPMGFGPRIDSEVSVEALSGAADGFVAIGRGCTSGLTMLACIWRLSDTGESWELLPADPIFERADLKAVASTQYGWIAGGGVYPDGPPRAAIWWSLDGRAWQRVADGPVFDAGGQWDVGQGPDDIIVGQGGIDGLASDGTTVVAVGRTCDETGGRCTAAAWSSADGRTWTRSTGFPAGPETGSLQSVVAMPTGYVAFGRRADSEADLDQVGRTFAVRSEDGHTWRQLPATSFPDTPRPVAAAAIGDGVAVVMTHGPTLEILGSRDGISWEVIHEATWEPVVVTVPSRKDPKEMVTLATHVADVVMTERPDGSAIVMGRVYDPPSCRNDTTGCDSRERARFVYRVTMGPSEPR